TAGCSTIELSGNAESTAVGILLYHSGLGLAKPPALPLLDRPSPYTPPLDQLSPRLPARNERLGSMSGPLPLKGEGSLDLGDVAAAFEGLGEGALVGVFEVAADGQTARDAGDAHAERLEELGEINGRGLALHARVCGEDDFLHAGRLEAHQELAHTQVLGANAVEGRQG